MRRASADDGKAGVDSSSSPLLLYLCDRNDSFIGEFLLLNARIPEFIHLQHTTAYNIAVVTSITTEITIIDFLFRFCTSAYLNVMEISSTSKNE